MTTPLLHYPDRSGSRTGKAISAFTGRLLAEPAIRSSPHARVTTAYNAEGLIVAAPDPTAAAAMGATLREVLAEYSCELDGPDWLAPGEIASTTTDSATTGSNTTVASAVVGSSHVLASGVRIVPGAAPSGDSRQSTPGGQSSGPDPWSIVEQLRARLGPHAAGTVGLNHLMTSAEQVGGNPFAIGHGRVGLDGYGVTDAGGHGPVMVTLQPPRPRGNDRRPRVVVLDTGIGDHPWFSADPAATTVEFADGVIVGPDVASSPQRLAATAESPAHDTALIDPLLGTLPTHTGHGTFIAGLIRQACPRADIVALTVMQANGIVPEHKLIRALDVLRSRQRECPGWADAIVLSLGYYAETGEDVRYTSGLKDILLDLGRLGVAVFAAAGNDATSRPSYPAAFAIDPDFADPAVLPVVSVAAVGPDGLLAPFSNFGEWVTGEAPGVNLVSASPMVPDASGRPAMAFLGPGRRLRAAVDPDDYRGFAVWSGTSFAAPILAGRYLMSLIDHGFPTTTIERRGLLPIGRPSLGAAGW